ncbi:MAG: MFS transporter, partial [Calditrichaeota bacterium]
MQSAIAGENSMSLKKFAPPGLYIPTLYFIEGLPYILVNSVSVYMFKSFGLSNRFIGLAGILMLPWVLKMLWAPLVDITSSKRQWTVVMQFILAVCTLATAAAFHLSFMATFVVLFLFLTAFASATHDIAADGYYLLALDSNKQAFFVGIRSTAYRIAMIAGGGIAAAAGMLERVTKDIPFSWSTAYGAIALVFLGSYFFHRRFLPRPENSIAPIVSSGIPPFFQAFRTYFQQPKIVVILLF